jgi:Cu-Zn family superoxide dismutase
VNAQGQKIGTATLALSNGGVRIDLDMTQLPPGVHAIHIHTVEKCEGPDFITAGGHFNPDMKKHGKDNPDGPHAGDLLNITVAANGSAKASLVAPNSVFHQGGSAIVIHAKEDDYKSDPAGNSGTRIACGVIQK